jgi:uncharacterized protein YdhG (YjbR/CyaY superfamily)
MAKTTFKSVDDYITSFPPATQRVLQQVRSAIRRGLPGAEEVISYGIAGYRVHGHVAVYFAGWKKHYSFYPAGIRLIAAFRKELEPYEFNEKGTVRFPVDQPVPARLIAHMATFRADEVKVIAAAKASKKTSKKAAKRPVKQPVKKAVKKVTKKRR